MKILHTTILVLTVAVSALLISGCNRESSRNQMTNEVIEQIRSEIAAEISKDRQPIRPRDIHTADCGQRTIIIESLQSGSAHSYMRNSNTLCRSHRTILGGTSLPPFAPARQIQIDRILYPQRPTAPRQFLSERTTPQEPSAIGHRMAWRRRGINSMGACR